MRKSWWGEVVIPAPLRRDGTWKLSRKLRDLEVSHERALLSLEIQFQQLVASTQQINQHMNELPKRLGINLLEERISKVEERLK
jgi:hypothetical protein